MIEAAIIVLAAAVVFGLGYAYGMRTAHQTLCNTAFLYRRGLEPERAAVTEYVCVDGDDEDEDGDEIFRVH